VGQSRGSAPHTTFLAKYNDADLVLDLSPYCGGPKAQSMGVPNITLPGKILASHDFVSHPSNAGFAEWVARDLTDYRTIALSRTSAPAGSTRLRDHTAVGAGQPVTDPPRFGPALRFAIQHVSHASSTDRRSTIRPVAHPDGGSAISLVVPETCGIAANACKSVCYRVFNEYISLYLSRRKGLHWC
jgi:hypothetical protein